jgi:hypothetical protein
VSLPNRYKKLEFFVGIVTIHRLWITARAHSRAVVKPTRFWFDYNSINQIQHATSAVLVLSKTAM